MTKQQQLGTHISKFYDTLRKKYRLLEVLTKGEENIDRLEKRKVVSINCDFEAVLFNPNSSILRLFGDCAWLLPLSVSNRAYMVGQNLTTKEELMVIHLPNH